MFLFLKIIFFAHQLSFYMLCVSGLVVKSIVAIDGPRVRFAADALLLHFLVWFCVFATWGFVLFALGWERGCVVGGNGRRGARRRWHGVESVHGWYQRDTVSSSDVVFPEPQEEGDVGAGSCQYPSSLQLSLRLLVAI